MASFDQARVNGAAHLRRRSASYMQRVLDALASGPLSSPDLQTVTGLSVNQISRALVYLRETQKAVQLLRTQTYTRRGRHGSLHERELALYALPGVAEAWVPYQPIAARPRRAHGMPPKKPPRQRTQSGSGVIAPAPFYRGMLWGAGGA